MTNNTLKIGYAIQLLEELTDLEIKLSLHLISPEKYNEELDKINQDMIAL